MKIKFGEKVAYGLGDVGANLVWSTIGSFLTIYYTDNVGIAAAVVGTMMLLTRLVDGLSDLVMGALIQKTNTRIGKARPWFLASIPMMSLGLIALFNVPSSLGDSGKLIYAYVTYIFIAAVAFTASNLSYSTMLSLMTNDRQERTEMSAMRLFFAFLTILTLSFLTPKLTENFGFGKTACIYAVAAAIALSITFLKTKERVNTAEETKGESLPLKKAFPILFKNKYFLVATAFFLLTYTTNTLCNGTIIYHVTYILGDRNYYGMVYAGMTIPIILGLPILPKIVTKIGRCRAMLIGYLTQFIGYVVLFTVADSVMLTLIGLILVGVGRMPVMSSIFAFVTDVIDYGEWKTGVRLDGLTNCVTSFGQKVGTGIGSAAIGWILAAGAYQANAVQSDSAIFAIKVALGLVPMCICAINVILTATCKMDKEYPQIAKDLKERRK